MLIGPSKQRRVLVFCVSTSVLAFVLAIAAVGVPDWITISYSDNYGSFTALYGLWIACIPNYNGGTSCAACKSQWGY